MIPLLPAQPHDPALLAALDEIKPILAKYDLAASVLVQSKTHNSYLVSVSPSWSCLTLEPTPDGHTAMRFRAPLSTGTPEEKEGARLTVSMVMGFCDAHQMLLGQFQAMAAAIGRHVEINHISRFTPL